MRVGLAFDVGEVVGEDDAPAGCERGVCPFDEVAGTVGSLGAADVPEHHEVVVVGLEVDGVEVAGPQLAAVRDVVLGGLGGGDVDDPGQVVDHRGCVGDMR